MRASDERLVQRLQERNADRERATDGRIHPINAVRPATDRALRDAEAAIGFMLPDLLRAIYTTVANGGFGPEYGIVGTKGGVKLDECTLETAYRNMVRLAKENPVWRWPGRLLPLANYGCGMWSCVDCEYQKLPMILWDPNGLDAELDGADARINWGNSFWDQGLSLRRWLEGWLGAKEPPEPTWPSDSWIRKRLGFQMPKEE